MSSARCHLPDARPRNPASLQPRHHLLSPAERDKAPALLQFLFAHTPGYPAEPPLVRLRSEKGLSDARVASASAVVDRVVGEHLGTPMVYDLITAAREWLMEAAGQASGERERTGGCDVGGVRA